ncbi:response regulator [Amylibacter sp.]|jgi:two-component system nitrogen regulation response regulator GlnG|nr:response regulator [Amylibacter sp.]
MDGTILVADDDRTIRAVLTQALTRAGCKVRATGSIETLWRWIDEGDGDVVISDVNLPDGDGLEMLPAIKRKRKDLPVIIISAQNTVITAIKASELGAYDYLPKPFDLKKLLSKVNKALSNQGSNNNIIQQDGAVDQELPLIGSSPLMQDVYRFLARVLHTDLSTIITGESGTGKDLLAHTMHDLGPRAPMDFVRINISSSNIDKIEGTLIGGKEDLNISPALKSSTIYFDEISEMSDETQLQLLDLLRSDAVISKNYRFISSSRLSLQNLISQGIIREDLFYRLNVVNINLPPLRDRVGDIPDLTKHFLQQSALSGMPKKVISAKAIQLLQNAPWAGNIRELENFINSLVVLISDEEITPIHVEENLNLIPSVNSNELDADNGKLSSSVEKHIKRYFDLHGDNLPPPGLYNRILKEIELPLIALSLSATRGNQIKTSELLGINRNTLRKKIKDLDIVVTRSKKMM